MRKLLWERYGRLFGAGDAVLDVGCGTGIDAGFLARTGVRVVGIDASPSMIAQARTRLGVDPFKELVELRVLDIRDIGSLPAAGFDGIISAFASLSTVADLEAFALQATSLLRPRGAMVLHLLNRSSLWEWLGLVRHGRVRAARRLGRQVERNFMIGGRPVRHYLYHAREAYARFFAAHFRLRRAYGLGILRPPHTLRRLPPAVVTALDRLERPVRATRPFADWGRFFVLELEKR
jgi:SAM-dependent methyltransferase